MKWHIRRSREDDEGKKLWGRFKAENEDQIRLVGVLDKADSFISEKRTRMAKAMMVTDETRRKEAMKTLEGVIEQRMIQFNTAFNENQAAAE